ncbi:DASH complex, subunit Spc34 [Hypoxylon rubiginosum]|uniref:DASH complex, subunit Spc34 n=1 Tax=Hypoxylon rubiginosum TaxID=110542 RepID=A0ACB9YPA7_9PEZI|nr:DASH complex, subunit Spc34 [Hypoxylon rubiginosum]
MSLLSAHFEQIAISCQGIDSLPFPPPKIFTNALLANEDITSLIRDTEAHERALFSVPPPPPPSSLVQDPPKSSGRRQTVFNVASGEVTTSGGDARRNTGAPRRHTAVAAVLGGDLHDQIRRSERRGGKDDVDVELLLKGAEKLCGVYPLPGALERIAAQRSKYAHSRSTLAYYEAKVAEQAEALGRMNKDHWMDEEEEDDADDGAQEDILTEEDLRREEEEVRELDKKKKELQERLKAMEKDLGGLLNM